MPSIPFCWANLGSCIDRPVRHSVRPLGIGAGRAGNAYPFACLAAGQCAPPVNRSTDSRRSESRYEALKSSLLWRERVIEADNTTEEEGEDNDGTTEGKSISNYCAIMTCKEIRHSMLRQTIGPKSRGVRGPGTKLRHTPRQTQDGKIGLT